MAKNKLQRIYRRTDGFCHLCHKKLSYSNYSVIRGSRGAWSIEYSKPKVKGVSDHINNLFPACISCNEDKGTKSTKVAGLKYDKNVLHIVKLGRREKGKRIQLMELCLVAGSAYYWVAQSVG